MDPDGLLPAPATQWLQARATQTLHSLNAPGEVRVRVLRDPAMAAAHERFGRAPGTTDVLTFDFRDGGGDEPLDADILVCIDEAARQAARRGHSVEQELLLYVVHGMLHCLGHDDHDPDAAAAMHAAEDRILESLGVGITYARAEEGRP